MKTQQIKPELELIGQDGNAFMILGLAKRAATKAGWTAEQWTTYKTEATAGNYDNLLQVTMKYFDVS